jgi:phage protein D
MNDFTKLYNEARRTVRPYYAPAFELHIDGAGLPRGVLRDVIELRYHDDVTEIDNFEITVNNWDAASNRCKYIGSESEKQLDAKDPSSLLFKLFEPCNKLVKLSLGYVGNLVPMMTGNFTTMEPSFPSSGPPTLTVRGLNVLHQLRSKKYSYAWSKPKKWTASSIARDFNTLRDKGKPRLKPPWTIETDPTAEGLEKPIEYVAQTDQYDVDFLLNLARTWSYELEVDNARKVLKFGPGQQSGRSANYQLDWGSTLIEFTPSLSTANQWKSVTVRGWDRKAQQPISETIPLDDPQIKKVNRDLHEMIEQCDPREQQVVDLPVFTRDDAKAKGRAMLHDRVTNIVKAKGRTVGLPQLRAGSLLNIQSVGARLSGTYFVTKTTHTIGDQGYTTEFECRRQHLGGQPRKGG